jgi:hypothetical protein
MFNNLLIFLLLIITINVICYDVSSLMCKNLLLKDNMNLKYLHTK